MAPNSSTGPSTSSSTGRSTSSPASMTSFTATAFIKKLADLTPFSGNQAKNQNMHFALAVSGGADSLSLLALAAAAKKKTPHWRFTVLTVNHGLRAAAVKETRHVAKLAKAAGLASQILTYKGTIPDKDIQAAARDIRYGLMSDWCVKHKADYLVTAHHLEDQAETFLLRLARGSGLDGLSAMQSVGNRNGVTLLRPFLDVPRARLHKTVAKAGLEAISDPSNMNRRFARVRMREKMDLLAEEGLTAPRLAETAGRLLQARKALEHIADMVMQSAVRVDDYDIAHLDHAALRDQPEEILRRILNRILTPYGGYPPRAESVQRILDEVFLTSRYPQKGATQGGKTVNGFIIRYRRDGVLVFREASGLPAALTIKAGQSLIWDDSHIVRVAKKSGLKGILDIKPLGSEGLKSLRHQFEDDLPKNLPAAALHALPSVWLTYRKKSHLVAVKAVLSHPDVQFEDKFWL